MKILRGHSRADGPCALTIGNFDGVHRGHQAMLALLNSEARHRGLPSTVLTFEPHPRDFFAARPLIEGAGLHIALHLGPDGVAQALGVLLCPAKPLAQEEFVAAKRYLTGP